MLLDCLHIYDNLVGWKELLIGYAAANDYNKICIQNINKKYEKNSTEYNVA